MLILKKVTLSFSLFLIFLIGFTPAANAQSNYSDDTFIILFDPNTSLIEIDLLRQEFNSTELWVSPYSNIRCWKVNSFPFTLSTTQQEINDINEGTEAAKERSSVDGAGLNYSTLIPSMDKAPSNPAELPNCNIAHQIPDNLSLLTNEKFNIAIMDTGIAEFGDSSVYFNPIFEGDYIGRDFVNNDQLPDDDHGHGTHIAGIISNFRKYFLPVSFEYFIYKTHDHEGEGYLSDIILALDDAILQQVDMVNMSFSYAKYFDPTDFSTDPFEHQIELAKEQGILIMASAGNATNDNDEELRYYPASFSNDNIISVASVDCNDRLSYFSNYGSYTVDVATPGESIDGPDLNGDLAVKSGTSQSCAMTTKAAMIIAREMDTMDWVGIKCRILEGAIAPNYEIQSRLLAGIVDLENSLAIVTCIPPPPNPFPSVGQIRKTNREMISFNNPVSHTLQIDYLSPDDFNLDIVLFDLAGNQIISYLGIKNEKTTISISELPAGLYLLDIKDRLSGKSSTHKIVKQ